MSADSYGWSAQELADMGVPCLECNEHPRRHITSHAYVPDVTALCDRCRGTGIEPGDPREPGCQHCDGLGWYE